MRVMMSNVKKIIDKTDVVRIKKKEILKIEHYSEKMVSSQKKKKKHKKCTKLSKSIQGEVD